MMSPDKQEILLDALNTIKDFKRSSIYHDKEYYNDQTIARIEFIEAHLDSLTKYFFIESDTLEKFVTIYSEFSDQLRSWFSRSSWSFPSDSNQIAELVEKVYKRILEIDRDFANDVSNTLLQNARLKFEKKIEDLSEYTKGIVSESTNLSNSIEKTRQESVSNAEQIKEVLKQVQNEWEEFRAKYKDLFAKGEVVRQSQNFLSISQLYTQRANFWRATIVAIVIVLLIVSILFLRAELNFTYSNAYQTARNVGKEYFSFLFYTKFGGSILLKAFILSIIIYILRFGVRNYNALMHNATINSHKHNSLDAALRLIEGITSSELQNEILAKAGKEIFNQHSTGYLEKENTVSNLSIADKVTDIVKKAK